MKMIKKTAARTLQSTLNSGAADTLLILFAFFSFYIGQESENMGVFASSGGIMTIFGLFKMIKFSTIEQYLKLDETVQRTTGMTGPPVAPGEDEKNKEEAQRVKRENLEKQLGTEFRGISLTILGTFIASYGSFLPII